MKTAFINRTKLAALSSVLAVTGLVGLTVPVASAAPVDPCPTIIGDDGQPITLECDPTPVADTISPYVSISNPSTTTLKRNQLVVITALAGDNVGVVSTNLYVNDVLVGSAPSSTAGASWTPTQRGTYTITAQAFDAAGNVGTATLTVSVK